MLRFLFRLSLISVVVTFLITAATGKMLSVFFTTVFVTIGLFFLRLIW